MPIQNSRQSLIVLGAALLAATSPVVAQETAPTTTATAASAPAQPPAPPPPACELHVFPTLEGQAMTSGWLAGFGVVGAIADASANHSRNVGDAAYLKESLAPKMQVEALKSVDLVAELKLDPSQIIFEAPVADRKISTNAATRLTASTAPCYAELLVTQNFYHKAAIYGRSLNNRFIFKDFRTGKTSTALVKGRGGNGLALFPPKTEGEADAAEKELRDVFVKNFQEFAKGLHPVK